MRPAALLASCLLIPSLTVMSGCGAKTTPPPANQSEVSVLSAPGVPGGVITVREQLNARVTAKDEQKRTVTLLGNDAKEQTIDVPEAAVNFPQLKVGDLVVATKTEEIAAVVIPAGVDVAQGEALVAALAEKGQKPGGAAAAVVQVRATVKAIDAATRTATIVADNGKQRVLPVRADIDLGRYKVGDQVVMRITSLMTVEVQAAKPAEQQ